MASKLIKSFLFLSLLLISASSFSSGMVDPLSDVKIVENSIFKVSGNQMKARRMALDLKDYDDTKANNRHDPKKPGNGKP